MVEVIFTSKCQALTMVGKSILSEKGLVSLRQAYTQMICVFDLTSNPSGQAYIYSYTYKMHIRFYDRHLITEITS